MRPLTFQRSQDPAGMGSPPWARRDPWDQEKVVSRLADRARGDASETWWLPKCPVRAKAIMDVGCRVD